MTLNAKTLDLVESVLPAYPESMKRGDLAPLCGYAPTTVSSALRELRHQGRAIKIGDFGQATYSLPPVET